MPGTGACAMFDTVLLTKKAMELGCVWEFDVESDCFVLIRAG